ncbi:hypothetical protein [Candidatus Poriferisodalis sp.]|uniref:hypothetical protein n=1 Tax=Candidatus Poriferisodalis sp. TaxID=3101277 RepID=UPI003B023369
MKFIILGTSLSLVSLHLAPAASAGPAFTLRGGSSSLSVGTQAERPSARDPALGDLHIEVDSRDPAHKAERVGEAANLGLSSLSFPRPVPLFAPPAQRVRTLVGIDTWFWVPAASWRPIVRVVAAGSVVVTLVATPVTLQLMPGDGSLLVSCPGPGLPWLVPGTRSLCSHVFQRASTAGLTGRFRGTVQSVWTVRWTSSTGLSGIAGPVVVPTPVSLRVVEAQPVLER